MDPKRLATKRLPVLAVFALGTFALGSPGGAGAARAADPTLLFPRPFFIAIDDMGWNEGSSLAATNGPWRLGVRRRFDLRDYRAVVELGRRVGMRLQGSFILGEMDREGIVAEYPTAAAPGSGRVVGPEARQLQLEVMQYVKDNAAHLEFGLHGVGHEHWEDGIRRRAEWYDLDGNKPWSEQDGRDHVALFARIMAQYGWTPENGQSFPESFVPCANAYYWNPEGEYSTGKLMAENGVKYANTDLSFVSETNPPTRTGGGFDHGLLVVHRQNYGNEWFALAALPAAPINRISTDIIETHWTNLLAQDDWLQRFVNERWEKFFRAIQARPNRYLAKNTEQFSSQWLYKRHTLIRNAGPGVVRIDNTAMPEAAYRDDLLGNLVLAVKLDEGMRVSRASLDGESIPAYFEEAGYGYLYLPPLDRRVYQFEYAVGEGELPIHVHHTGTFNVYSVATAGDSVQIDLEMYGTQVVEVTPLAEPRAVRSLDVNLRVLEHHYDPGTRALRVTLTGRDMQGERGTLEIWLDPG